MITLIPCDENGQPLRYIADIPEPIASACAQSSKLYQRIGYKDPWVSYIAVDSGRCAGGGAFVGRPTNGMVEIAYFTLDDFQNQGYATSTARRLIEIARQADPALVVRAFTLPQINASTRILDRLGFSMVGPSQDADVGEVWEWQLQRVHPETAVTHFRSA